MPTIQTGYRNYSRFYLSWSVARQDIANNRSLINWTAGIQGQPGYTAYWYSNAVRINSVYIAGQGNLASGTWSNITLANGATVPLRSGSIWVGHNSDGTRSVSASINGWLYANGNISASGTSGIATIPRNSQVTTNDGGSWTLGTPITISTNRRSSSFTHTITIRRGGSSGPVIRTINNVGASVVFTPTAAEVNALQNATPNANRVLIHITQRNNQVGQNSTTQAWAYIRNANPIFNNFTYRDSNAEVVAITGNNQVLVKGKSTLEVTIPESSKMQTVKGANPRHYSIVYDGVNLQQPYQDSLDIVDTISQINTTGQRALLVTATDSRTNNTSVARQVLVYDYTPPTIESTLMRANNFGSNTTVSVRGEWNQLVIDGESKNSLIDGSLRYRYREDTGSFGPWQSRSFTVNGNKWEIASSFVVSLDNKKKYVFEFQIADRFGAVVASDNVDVGRPIMFVGENSGEVSIGIGKMPEDGSLDVEGDIYSRGRIVPSGGWNQIGRIIGPVGSTPSTIDFPEYRYIRVVANAIQATPMSGATQYTINIRLNGMSGSTSYNRSVQRMNSSGVTAVAAGNTNAILMGVTNDWANGQSYSELEFRNFGSVRIANWTQSSNSTDWSYAYGRYIINTGSPITSLLVYSSMAHNVDLIVYGHN